MHRPARFIRISLQNFEQGYRNVGKYQGRKRLGIGAWNWAAVVAITGAPIAASAADGAYLGLTGGANFLDDQNFSVIYPNNDGPVVRGTGVGKVRFDTGWAGGLVVGYAYSNGLRPELELMYRSDDLKRVTISTFGLGGALQPNGIEATGEYGSQDAQTAMANLWFDLFKSSRIRPYIGGGIGALRVEFNDAGYDGQPFRNDSDVKFAYQGGAGIGFDLTPNWTLSLDYRYVEARRSKINLVDDQPETRVKFRYQADTALLTLRYGFGAAPVAADPVPEPAPPVDVVPVPPAAEPEPTPAPTPACDAPAAGQSFSLDGCKVGDKVVLRGVTFEFDKARLTPDARVLLDMVSDALLARTDIQVEVAGHTDSKGSDAYNQKLSERRALAVKEYLAGRGVEPSRMTAVGYGEVQPVADNGTDEGREYNRRTELKVTASSGNVESLQARP